MIAGQRIARLAIPDCYDIRPRSQGDPAGVEVNYCWPSVTFSPPMTFDPSKMPDPLTSSKEI